MMGMEQKACYNENEIKTYFLVYAMIGGTNESYYSNKELITSNFLGIYFSDTNHPELEDKILFAYDGILTKSVKDFFNYSKCAYKIYKEYTDDKLVTIVAFTADHRFIHDYNNFKNNIANISSFNYYNYAKNTVFESCSTAKKLFEKCMFKKIMHLKKQKKDLILNLYEAPVEGVEITPSFCLKIFNTITQLMQISYP